MALAASVVKTERASFYLQLLCRHFALKVESEFDASRGRVDFRPGLCVMEAADDALSIRCEADDAAALGRVKYILEDHLVRFGKRDGLEVVWQSI